MAQITVIFSSYEEMKDFANQILEEGNAPKVEKATKVEEQAAKREEAVPYGQQIAEHFSEETVSESTYTLLDVRTALAKLNKEGKKAQVQELIKSFGVDKLSQIPEEKYPEVMKKAGEL